MKNSIVGVDHLFEAHLPVADLDASVVFYRDLVGLELAHVVAARQAAFFWVGARGSGMLACGRPVLVHIRRRCTSPLRQRSSASLRHRERSCQRASPRPTSIGRPTHEPVVLAWMPAAAVYFRDPDGHLLEYIAMLAEEPRLEAGVVAWHQWTRR